MRERLKEIVETTDNKQKEVLLRRYGLKTPDLAPLAQLPGAHNAYGARVLDELHEYDHGVWGSHIRLVLLEEVQRAGGSSGLSRLDSRLRSTKASKTAMTDGNTERDLLKLAPIYTLDLLPADLATPLLLALRALALFRTILDSAIISEGDLSLLEVQVNIIGIQMNDFQRLDKERFEAESGTVPSASWYRSKPKTFNGVPKYHGMKHAANLIRTHGAPTHGDTRQGEGVHVRLKELMQKTTHRDADEQLEKRLRVFAYDWLQNDGATASDNPLPLGRYPEVSELPTVSFARLDLVFRRESHLDHARALLYARPERHDTVALELNGNLQIARLEALFVLSFEQQDCPVALVTPLEPVVPRPAHGHLQLTAPDMNSSIFVRISNIVRPVLVQEIDVDNNHGNQHSQFFLNDTIDLDVYKLLVEHGL
ncbi:hypothetical protein Rhopal_005747-T1 [Rhodotorula paludigena]|uniref:Uncharacterized protein n=1 Tax=Rhodotorula paludigena TaxID=86838 RepID=A0AAV5GTL3_9BASI|nr:hypothetical protein Rhopal_005747-T1 [Rhodotorula paludigena]